MQKIKGRYTEARIFADVVEQAALDQIQTLCDQPFAEGSSIAVMPDVHAGAGCTEPAVERNVLVQSSVWTRSWAMGEESVICIR